MIKYIFILFGLFGYSFAANEIVVNIGNQAIVSNNAIALAKGFVKEEFNKIGVSFKVANFDSGRDINSAFAGKSIDFGFLGTTPFVIGAVNNLDVAVVSIDFISYKGEGLVGRQGKFKSINDIKGQKIAVPFGTSAHFALLQMLKIHNISPSEVKILDIPAGSILSAWERKDVDLAVIWELTLSKLKDKEFLYTDKDLSEKGIILADVLAVRKEFALKHPEIIKAYKNALDRAYQYRQNDPNGAAKVIAKFFNIDESVARFQLDSEISKPISRQEEQSSKLLGTKDNKGAFYENLYQIAEFLKNERILRKIPPKEAFGDYIIY